LAGQMTAALLILLATIGITFTLQARFADRASVDMAVRLVLAALALVVLLHPSEQVAALACLPVVMFISYWLIRRRPAGADESPNTTAAPVLAGSFAESESAGRTR
jgi:hypothetical protein